MTNSLAERAYLPGDIEAATDGYCTRRVQQVWHARRQWVTPTDTPPAGKPRRYRLEHVYEAAIIAALVKFGLTIGQARDAIMKRCELFFMDKRRAESGKAMVFGFEGEFQDTIFELPEFRNADPSSPIYWSVVMGRTIWDAKPVPYVSSVRAVEPRKPVAAAIRQCEFIILFDVTKTIVRVNEVLEQRQVERAFADPLQDGDQ